MTPQWNNGQPCFSLFLLALLKWLILNCEDTYPGRNLSLRFGAPKIRPPFTALEPYISLIKHICTCTKSGPKITIPTRISTHSIYTQPVPISPGRGTEDFWGEREKNGCLHNLCTVLIWGNETWPRLDPSPLALRQMELGVQVFDSAKIYV